MQKNKQIICIILLIVFSVFTLFLNAPSINKKQQQEFLAQQRIKQIMQKEAVLLANTNYAYVNNGYVINSEQDLLEFKKAVNEDGVTHSGITVKLACNITLTSDDFGAIGSGEKYFAGTFDGQKHYISNLNIKEKTFSVGLFGKLNGATIQNLTVGVNSIVCGEGQSAGAIAGEIYGATKIEKCFAMAMVTNNSSISSKVNVTSSVNIGGIVGYANCSKGEISRCYNQVNLLTSNNGVANVGGIVGFAKSSSESNTLQISECESHSKKIFSGDADADNKNYNTQTYVGGILGKTDGISVTITNCLNNSPITAKTAGNVTTLENTNVQTGSSILSGVMALVQLDFAKDVDSEYVERECKAGGIVGSGGNSTTAQDCVSLASISSWNNSVTTTIKYFFGRKADQLTEGVDRTSSKTVDVTSELFVPTQSEISLDMTYGDYYDMDIYTYQNTSNGIGFDLKSSTTNFSKYFYPSELQNDFKYDIDFRVYNACAPIEDNKYLDVNNYGGFPLQYAFTSSRNLTQYAFCGKCNSWSNSSATTWRLNGDDITFWGSNGLSPVSLYIKSQNYYQQDDNGNSFISNKGTGWYNFNIVWGDLDAHPNVSLLAYLLINLGSKSSPVYNSHSINNNCELADFSKSQATAQTQLTSAYNAMQRHNYYKDITSNIGYVYNSGTKTYDIQHIYNFSYNSNMWGGSANFSTSSATQQIATHNVSNFKDLNNASVKLLTSREYVLWGDLAITKELDENIWLLNITQNGSTTTVNDVYLKWVDWSNNWTKPQ